MVRAWLAARAKSAVFFCRKLWKQVETIKDYGGNERITLAQLEEKMKYYHKALYDEMTSFILLRMTIVVEIRRIPGMIGGLVREARKKVIPGGN